MGDLRAAVQESWARAVLAASSVEEQAKELAGRITQSFQEGPLSPEHAQKLLAEVAAKLREHRRQLHHHLEDAVRRGVERMRPARAQLDALRQRLQDLEAKLARAVESRRENPNG
jgi:polyhydroxyalkanoate synthesis regulator phasin